MEFLYLIGITLFVLAALKEH